jgi:putative aldouronate transport system substrate-binding protein
LLSYGLKDVDYTPDPEGNPIFTTRGPADTAYVNWRLISPPPPVLYYADLPGLARVVQDAQHVLASMAVADPTAGYFSPTFLSRGRPLEAAVSDGINDIIAGRRPMSDYDGLLKDWPSNGGDTIRHEYLELMTAGRSS